MNAQILDMKDRKLLFELDSNARASLSFLSKKVGLSKQAIDYRIKRMVERKIINGFYSVINTNMLGYMFSRFMVEFKNTTPEKEDEIVQYAMGRKDFGWILLVEGKWNFITIIWASDVTEIKKSVNEFIFRYGSFIKSYDVTIATKISHFQHKYILNKTEGRVFMLGGPIEKQKIDATDYEILSLLDSDARLSLSEISSKLDVSYKVVSYRIRNLEKKGIISGYRASINNHALGLTHYKVFLIMQNLTEKKLKEFKSYLEFNPNVIYITEAIGFADIEFEVLVKSHIEFNEMMRELRFRFSGIINDYETLILYKFYKMSYLPQVKPNSFSF